MTLLEGIDGPADLRALSEQDLPHLAADIRRFLISEVAKTGGHLGPNLGVVELTIALHRVFDSPRDTIVFDTGHQSYVHKLLTGRHDFSRLKAKGGLSGYPSRAESEHDVVENSHASTATSWAAGIARANTLSGRSHRRVVAVIGDGALTGGMAWEALNNIAADPGQPLVIVVNDNGRSYSPTIGGLADHLAALRTNPRYEAALEWGRRALRRAPGGETLFRALHAAKEGVKDVLAPQVLFADLGLKYLGPVDGHDLPALQETLRLAHGYGGPVVVHAITAKGRGYGPAEADEAEQFHVVGPIDPVTGRSLKASALDWTSVFAEEVTALGARRRDLVTISAAMRGPVGLDRFAEAFPTRFFDVGIAEQHAVTMAAGMAMGGLHPVIALYATFLNRAYDQVLLDLALHRLPVTIVLDRAGITGSDGPSHNGMWDLSMLGTVPGLRVAAPRDAATLRVLLGEAIEVDDAPTVLRYPKGTVGADIPALDRVDGLDVLHRPTPTDGEDHATDVLLISVGAMAAACLAAAELLHGHGISTTVIDPRWVLPVPASITALAVRHRHVVTVEDNSRAGGVGQAVSGLLREAGLDMPLLNLAIPRCFPEHASRNELLAEMGLTGPGIARATTGWISHHNTTSAIGYPTTNPMSGRR
ncbi:1-deoxy-D-xylulose-5-phosphate synthase [Actinoalloteichus sp. GBA129-24]|uniref:1-deoxy-D-xylulose-5-phosphate synthase n=1 Tax=Actinoalloteichus sp. GBA129-24 TaxID=1612551 RepID=UPI0009503F6C|nr:1-deoxy-D-xylulose-5-phosphate synthase [Actinoalloteichus sp. GBA129-24]APU21390.1 1-deoxy-D-xylulose-5-phosphate synthase [Actinoalloteichus sp. GBA129-24]